MSVLFESQHTVERTDYKRPHVRRLGEKDKRRIEEDLLVFGYACNLYCDDKKAMFFDEGKHLIPWMGDESLMIDRYDGRLLLEDLSGAVSKGSFDQSQMSQDELEVERQCDKERYLALEENVPDAEYEEEEEMKRFKAAIASEYSAVGFSYEQYYPQYNYEPTHLNSSASQYDQYTEKQPTVEQVTEAHEETPSFENPPQQEEVEVFIAPEELCVPDGMEVPDTAKLHAIIERTAFFIKDHGPQMEIVVKAKQSGNQQFDFLHFDHALNPYYKLILKAVQDGSYVAVSSKPPSPPTPPPEEDDSDDSDEDLELHPLLTASLRTPIVSTKKQPASVPLPEQPLPPGWTAVTTEANSRETSSPGIPGMSATDMAMAFLGSYAPHQSQMTFYPPPPPPPGESPPRTDEFETQPSNGSLPPQFPQGMYPGNHFGPGVSLVGPDVQNYAVNAGPPIIPPPPDLKPICDKLAEYVARNGQQFEDNIKTKGDPRFDFLNETSDHYTYYHMKRKEFEQKPSKSSQPSTQPGPAKGGPLVPYNKPVSFQIKAKDTKKRVVEYRSNILYKTAKADESDEEEAEGGEQSKEGDADKNMKESSQNGGEAALQQGVQGPKTQEDVMAEERATKLKQEKEKEVQRLEEEAKSTTSSLRRQVQLERRRRAQMFINMLKKTKPDSDLSSSNQDSSDTAKT